MEYIFKASGKNKVRNPKRHGSSLYKHNSFLDGAFWILILSVLVFE